MQWRLWKLYHNWVASRKTRMRWFLKEANSSVETRCKKSWDQFEKVRCTQSTLHQASIREKKGSSLRKIQVKNPHQRSPYAVKFEGRVPWRDWKTTAMRPKEGLEPFQKHIQAQREIQSYILLARVRVGTPGCVNKGVCIWSVERP